MKKIEKLLEERKQYLLRLRKEKGEALTNAPQGFLRICTNKNNVQYYHRTNPKDFDGKYIGKKDSYLAKQLAQKAYDEKIIRSAEKEIKAIENYFSNCPVIEVEHVYEKMHDVRKKLIEAIVQTDEEYIASWEAVQYTGKAFEEDFPEFYTAKGERVRSKTEVIIADLLYREGIPYRYEYPIEIEEWGRVYPDFTVLHVRERKELYWEHLGMMDDASYVENAIQKINVYLQNGICSKDNLIITYETKKNPLNQKTIKSMIEHYLK